MSDKVEENLDSRRMDWLERVGFAADKVHRWPAELSDRWPEYRWTARRISSEFKSAREAIDAAMAAEKQNG